MSSAGPARPSVKLLTALVGLAAALITLVGAIINIQPGPDPEPSPSPTGVPTPVPPDPSPSPTEMSTPTPPDPSPTGPVLCGPRSEPELSLSDGRGPSGTELTVSGSGFCPGDQIDIVFHTTDIATTRADDEGTFEVSARIPGNYDVFAPNQYDIRATARHTPQSTHIPFQLTVQ